VPRRSAYSSVSEAVIWCQRVGIASTRLMLCCRDCSERKLRAGQLWSAFPGGCRVFPSGEVAGQNRDICMCSAPACSSGASAWSRDALPIHASTRRAELSMTGSEFSVVLQPSLPFSAGKSRPRASQPRQMPGGRTVFFLLAERFHAAPTQPPRTGQNLIAIRRHHWAGLFVLSGARAEYGGLPIRGASPGDQLSLSQIFNSLRWSRSSSGSPVAKLLFSRF
jgi:hypothetical protein